MFFADMPEFLCGKEFFMLNPHGGSLFQEIDNPRMVAVDHRLLCPECKEILSRSDIESFTRCPFCNHDFGSNPALEDFILEPLVDNWMRRQPGFRPQSDDPPFQGREL